MSHASVPAALLFTDIEGSTALAHELGDDYVDLLAAHNQIMRDAIAAYVGVEARNEGDAFFAVFEKPADAVGTALAAQRALAAYPWAHGRPVRVRMGMHFGPIIPLVHDFAGLNVHLAARVCSAAHGGQVVASHALVEAVPGCNDFGWTDLGSHVVKDFADPLVLHQLAAEGLESAFAPLVTIDARDHNLPAMVTSFVGRNDELADLRTLLSSDARLVNVTGPGGVGKTRLAVEAAWSVLSRFRAGAWFVDFSSVHDPNSILSVVGETLGVHDDGHVDWIAAIADALASGPSLLVVDNLEHLLSGVTALSSLLAACPSLVVLATSRERLRLQGEHEVSLDGLDEADAVALFVARAALSKRDFIPNDATATLCRRVAGLPLAIELAAARLRTDSVESLVAAMDNMLDTLGDGERDRPARHQAMRAAIAVSVDALTEAERSVWRALSVFDGGATLDATGVVCGPKANEVASLVTKSLLRANGDRVVMLEPIRQFAEERLAYDEPGERERRMEAHAAYFLELAERIEPDLVSANQRTALDTLAADHANLLAACERATGDVALRIASCLTRFWIYRGHPHEGRAVLARALATNPDGDAALRAKALVGAGSLAVAQQDLDEARSYASAALATGAPRAEGQARNLIGQTARFQGDLDEAEAQFTAALLAANEADDETTAAAIRNNQGGVAFARNEFAEAADIWREALAMSERIGDQQTATRIVGNLGTSMQWLEDFAGARAAFEDSLELARANGDQSAEAAALVNIVSVMARAAPHDTGLVGEDLAHTMTNLHQAIAMFEALGYRRELAQTLLALVVTSDDVEECQRALSRSRALSAEIGDASAVASADSLRAMLFGADS